MEPEQRGLSDPVEEPGAADDNKESEEDMSFYAKLMHENCLTCVSQNVPMIVN